MSMINWVEWEYRKFKGFTEGRRGEPSDEDHKYYVGRYGVHPCIADVYDSKENNWMCLDVPFNSIEEAKQWCEAVEATGAY